MDDFRKRYDVPRRDYGMPAPGQSGQQPDPLQAPVPDQAQYLPPSVEPTQPQSQPQHQPPSAPQEPQPLSQPTYRRPTAPAAADIEARAQQTKRKINPKKAGIFAGVAVLLIGGAILIFKPSKTAAVMPEDLAKEASFSVYYPSSLPNGYIYKEDLATYQDGGAYYTFVKGPKHIIVRENVTSTGKLDSNEVTNPEPLDTPVGKAVIGTNTGQTAAAVLAGDTYIFIYSNNSVPKEEIIAIINKLEDISPDK